MLRPLWSTGGRRRRDDCGGRRRRRRCGGGSGRRGHGRATVDAGAGRDARGQPRHARRHVLEAHVLGLYLLIELHRLAQFPARLARRGQAEVQPEVAGSEVCVAEHPLQPLDRQLRVLRPHEQVREQPCGRVVVLVVGRHLLQQRDRVGVVARACGGLTALEGEPRARELLDALARLPGFLVEPRRGLVLARALVALRRLVRAAGTHVHGAGGGPALPGLVGLRGLRQESHRLVQLRGAEVVLALDEERRRLGDAIGLERDVASQVGRLHAVAGALVGFRRALGQLGAREQLGGLRELAPQQRHLGAFLEKASLDEDLLRARGVPGLREQPPGRERALLVRRGRGRGVRGAVGDVLEEVALVRLGRAERLAQLLVRFCGAQRVSALVVDLRGLVPHPGHGVEACGFQDVALLEEHHGGLRRLAGGGEHLRGLLVLVGLQVQLGGALVLAQPLEDGRGGEGLSSLDVGLGRRRQVARLLEQLAREHVVALLREPRHLAAHLVFGVRLPEQRAEQRIRAAEAQARQDLLVQDQQCHCSHEVGHERLGQQRVHGTCCRVGGRARL
jgi:hypothetical protein